MAVTVQNILDRIVSLIGRNQGEEPTDDEILFYMDAALKQLQALENWPNLRFVSELSVTQNSTSLTISTNVLKKINSISYIYNSTRVVVTPADPTQWKVGGTYPLNYTLSDVYSVLFDAAFPADGSVVVDRYEYLPLPATDESNGLIDTAPLLLIAQTMLNLAPKLRLETSDAAIYRSQVQDAYKSLSRWNASVLGQR